MKTSTNFASLAAIFSLLGIVGASAAPITSSMPQVDASCLKDPTQCINAVQQSAPCKDAEQCMQYISRQAAMLTQSSNELLSLTASVEAEVSVGLSSALSQSQDLYTNIAANLKATSEYARAQASSMTSEQLNQLTSNLESLQDGMEYGLKAFKQIGCGFQQQGQGQEQVMEQKLTEMRSSLSVFAEAFLQQVQSEANENGANFNYNYNTELVAISDEISSSIEEAQNERRSLCSSRKLHPSAPQKA